MRPSPTTGTVPVHHQIADSIRAQILSGELAPGDSIPTVAALAEQWSCATATVKAGLAVLRGEGRISGGRGIAAKVLSQPTRIKLALDWSQKQKDMVLRPAEDRSENGAIELTAGIPISATVSTHRYSRVPASDDLAAELGIEPGTELLQRDYEMAARDTGRRLSWSVSYIPVALIESNPDLLDETKEPWPGGHQHQLYTVGIELDRFRRSVIALTPTPGDRQAWGMADGFPLLRVRSRSIDINDRVVELSDAVYPSDRTEIEFTDQLRRWPADHKHYQEGDQ